MFSCVSCSLYSGITGASFSTHIHSFAQDLRELLGPALDQERIRYQQGLGDLEPGQFIVDNRDLQPVNGSNSESHSGPPQADTGEHQAILSRK